MYLMFSIYWKQCVVGTSSNHSLLHSANMHHARTEQISCSLWFPLAVHTQNEREKERERTPNIRKLKWHMRCRLNGSEKSEIFFNKLLMLWHGYSTKDMNDIFQVHWKQNTVHPHTCTNQVKCRPSQRNNRRREIEWASERERCR